MMASGFDLFRLIGSFVLVLCLLGAVLWGLRRWQTRLGLGAASVRRLKVLETLSLGTRQKIVLLQMGSREVAVGVTPTQINVLDAWEKRPASFAADLQMAAQAVRPTQEPSHGD